MFKLIISPRAIKELRVLKQHYKQAIELAFEDLKEDPYIGKPLHDGLKGRLAYKVGVYRIVYKINDKDKIINIFSAGHRGVVYK